MIAGLGVDIVEIDRMEGALARQPRFKERVFTEHERWYCEMKANPGTHYALRFAAKEAVLKSLGTGFSGMCFTDVEVVNDASGRPTVRLHGAAQDRADQLGIVEMHLSLSYTHSTAVASAVAITEGARPHREEKYDPKAEIAKSFKDLRAMLDDLEWEADSEGAESAESSAGTDGA